MAKLHLMARPIDTTPEARSVHLAALRRMSGPARVAMAFEMSDAARAHTEAGIRLRHPDKTDEQVHDELLTVLLGRELAQRVRDARTIPA